ncbi:late control D family protein [Roseibium polysiphoniae]|uniref:phage late control D family protein n=2 Tax=Alphaproteobacteria TaxID=28211 RepID=UPI00329837C8
MTEALWKTEWQVEVDGQDMTSGMRPYLTDISVTDEAGAASDRCSLTFDDTDGVLKMPTPGGSVRVRLNGVQVFSGVLEAPRSTGSRGGGRKLSVSAKGFDPAGKAKEPQALHQDDGTVGGFLKKLGERAGIDVEVGPELASLARDYLVADHESLLHVGERLARELGGTFKLRDGNRAVLIKRGLDHALPAVACRFSGARANGISWSISPVTGRKTFKSVKVRYFDRETADFHEEEVAVEQDRDGPDTVNRVRTAAADKQQATQIAEARSEEIRRDGGEGTVTLDLAPEAQAEGLCMVSGARPGINGSYRIVSVTHRASRSSGATTTLSLKQPGDGAGLDDR